MHTTMHAINQRNKLPRDVNIMSLVDLISSLFHPKANGRNAGLNVLQRVAVCLKRVSREL
jgi:hypothetical protein